MIEHEVYKITVEHYIQLENEDKFELEEPIICQYISTDINLGGSCIVLNEMFDKIKAYALERAKNESN